MIVCIYCKESKPPSREHALQRALGGDLVLREVCGACNGGFSAIDQALAQNSLVGLQRAGFTPPAAFDVKVGGDQFFTDPVSGLTFEIALRNHLRPEMYPQVHGLFGTSGSAALTVNTGSREDFERLASYLETKIKNGELGSVHVKIGPSEAGATPRLVMHRDNDGFLRGQSQADIDALRGVLQSQWGQVADGYRAGQNGAVPIQPREVKTPTVQLTLQINFNHVYRAVAKVAFNVMTAKMGAAFALRPEFDAIRDYIRGADVRLPKVEPGELAVDDRFVTAANPGSEAPIECDDHAVVLFGDAQGLLASVTLYKTSNFLVRLSEVAPADLLPQVHLFSATRSGNVALDLEEILRRIRSTTKTRQVGP